MNLHTPSPSPRARSMSMSKPAFFEWLATKHERYELVGGVPRLLPWVKRNHNRIVVNLVGLLTRALDPARFEVATGDFAIATGPDSIRYADVFVEAAGRSGEAREAESPILIVEVLSPSTTPDDFGAKRQEYLGLPTLDTYLIVAQDSRCVWQWTRGRDGEWPEAALITTEGEVLAGASGAALPLADVYRNVSD